MKKALPRTGNGREASILKFTSKGILGTKLPINTAAHAVLAIKSTASYSGGVLRCI